MDDIYFKRTACRSISHLGQPIKENRVRRIYKEMLLVVAGLCLGVVIDGIQSVRAELTFQTGFDYSSGDYGAPEKTRIVYVPFTLRSEGERHMFQMTVPYLRLHAPAGQTIIGPGGVPIQTSAAGRELNSGLGDVVTTLRYTLLDGTGSGLLLDVIGKIKFGTADDAKGLGTGEHDYSMQLDWAKVMNARFTLLATTGYRVYGDPAGVDFDNAFFASLGGVYKLTPDRSGGLIYDFRENITAGGDSQRELMLFMTQRTGKETKVQGYLLLGFSDASPDWGAGVLFSRGL